MHKHKKLKRFMAIILATMMIMPAFASTASAAVTLDDSYQLYMVPNTHLDTAWQWPYQHTADNYLRNMYNNQLSRLESNTDYKFMTSASKHYEWIKDYYNDDNPIVAQQYWERLKNLVDEGQWDITGGQVIEPDLNIPSGEALVRQSLYAQHFFEEEFGKDKVPSAGLVPDVFGFSGQLPQILYKSEMPYFVTSKINWNETTGQGSSSDSYRLRGDANRGRDSDILYWRALDGKTSVLSYLLYNDYNNTTTAGSVQAIFNQNEQEGKETGVKRAIAFYGGGDMGQGLAGSGGDSYGYVDTVNNGTVADVKMGTVTGYFEDVVANEDLSKIRTYEGEMYLEYHRGTYTTWSRVKKYNRDNEILAESAEKAATLGFYTGSTPTNSESRIALGWDQVLTNQMHDVLPGSALAYQYYVTYNQQEMAANMFNNVRDNALAALAYRADTETGVEGKPVFVYNELSWARDGEVTVDLEYDTLPSGVVVYDRDTPIFPSKVIRNEEKNKLSVTFMTSDVPAIGYKVFDVRSEAPIDRSSSLIVDETNLTFENDFLKMRINPETGYIASLQSMVNGSWHEAFAQNVGTEGAELHVYKDTEVRPPQNFDVWELNRSEIDKEPDWIIDGAPKSITIVENTPEKVTVRVVKEWSGSEIAQDMTMFANSDKVDVHLVADWYQEKRMLKVSFPILADTDMATYETSFGAVERPTDRLNPFQYARYEVPGHKWLDVTDKSDNYGVSILNDAKYGFDSLRRTLGGTTFVRSRITVARTPRAQAWGPSGASGGHSSAAVGSPWTPYLPYVVDSGTHEFTYSIYPHAGRWEDSETVNKAKELNYPMTAFETAKNSNNGLEASHSFASSDKSNVIISALKNQYDDHDNPEYKNTLIVRVYESSGRDTGNVTITLPDIISSAKEVNLLEHDFKYEDYENKELKVNGNQITFDIGKFEILTIEAEVTSMNLPVLTVAQESVVLDFNERATSSKSNRSEFFIDGENVEANPGLSMPEIKWPESGIDYQGINFEMGLKDGNNIVSGTTNVDVDTTAKYSKVYIVGFATGGESVLGDFTVNYKEGAADSKTIRFSDWRTDLSGWDRTAWIDNKPYVYDTIAHVNSHYHRTHGTTGGNNGYTAIMMTVDNYMFAYDIDVDSTKTIKSITLPDNPNIKIAAITLADPVEGYGKVYDYSKESDWSFEAPTPEAPNNVKVTYASGTVPLYKDFMITWDKAENAVKYRIHSGSTPDFVPSTANQLAEQGALNYIHSSPSILGSDAMAGLTKLYYKVIAIGRASNPSVASVASNGLAPQYIDYALKNSRVTANGRTNVGESWEMAIDGSLSTKWCVGGVSATNPAWLLIDLTGENDKTVKIDQFVLAHCGAGGEQVGANTSDFYIEYSANSTNGTDGTWTKGVDVTNNQASITTHVLDNETDARWVRLVITKPEYTPWSGAARIYGFNVIGKNNDFMAPPPTSTANNAKIELSTTIDNKLKLAVSYDYYNLDNDTSPGTKIEGDTVFKWYKKFSDVYGDVYALIPGATSKEIAQPFSDMQYTETYRCDITIYDNDGAEGETVTVETTPPISTANNAEIKSSTLPSNDLMFKASYDYYNALNDINPDAKTEGDTEFKWYKKIDGDYLEISEESTNELVQTFAEVLEAEAYKCDITIYDADGTIGKTVTVEMDTYINVLKDAEVVMETTTNNSARHMVDGKYDDKKWDAPTNPEYSGYQGPCPHVAVFDMGSVQNINKLKVFHANSYPSQSYDESPYIATYDFDLMYSVDGENWTTTEIRANTNPITTVVFGKTVQAQYVQIKVITPNAGETPEAGGFDSAYKAIRILEFEALSSIASGIEIEPTDLVSLYEDDVKLPSLDFALGKTVDVKIDYPVENDKTGEINVIVATYNDDGALLNGKQITVEIDEDGIVAGIISNYTVSQDAVKMKVFLCDYDTFAPISEAILVK